MFVSLGFWVADYESEVRIAKFTMMNPDYEVSVRFYEFKIDHPIQVPCCHKISTKPLKKSLSVLFLGTSWYP